MFATARGAAFVSPDDLYMVTCARSVGVSCDYCPAQAAQHAVQLECYDVLLAKDWSGLCVQHQVTSARV